MVQRGSPPALELGVQLAAKDGDVDELTRLLRQELLQLPVQAVELAGDEAEPATAKGFGLLAIGGLVVKLATGEAVIAVLDVVKAWIERDSGRSARLELNGNKIELTGLSSSEQKRLVGAWIAQVTAARPGASDA